MNTPTMSQRLPLHGRGSSGPLRPILYAWLAAGTLDILAAVITTLIHGGAPLNMLKAIASGLMGAQAFRGGLEMSALGLLMHYLIMLGIASIYALAAVRSAFARDHAVIAGLLYGVAVYAVMNLVVLPLSAIAFKPSYSAVSLTSGILVHMFCVGLPIALIVHRYPAKGSDKMAG